MAFELSAFHIALLFGAAGLLIAAAFSDSQRYRIPNWISAALLLLFPAFVLTAPSAVDWKQHLLIFGLLLVSGFFIFTNNIAGAGDIKLLAATGLWAGPHYVALFLVVTAIAGGVLSLLMAGLTRVRNLSSKERVALTKVPIPYGVAISVGGLSTVYMLSQPVLFPG